MSIHCSLLDGSKHQVRSCSSLSLEIDFSLVLGLRYCAGFSLVAVCGFLTVVASPLARHGLEALGRQ